MSAELVLENLSKRFVGSAEAAVAAVDLHVVAGSCTAILGPSGSGKSTVLRLIAGLELPDEGRVLIDGRDVVHVPAERRGVGMVFQKSLLFPHISVLDNVAFSGRVAGQTRAEARAKATEYLRMVQLDDFGARRVNELSGGQEQRVAIARALAASPTVLLLDEPFSALDSALRSDMHALIDDVRRAVEPTIVLVTHDRDEASRVADRIAILENGALLHESTVPDAYRRPQNVRASRLMGGRNEIIGVVERGVHRSAAGALPVRAGTADGPGVLVVRHEDVVVCEYASAAASSAAAPCFEGAIESLRVVGARTDVSVRCAPDLLLHAEVPSVHGRTVGDRVAVVLPPELVHVLPV